MIHGKRSLADSHENYLSQVRSFKRLFTILTLNPKTLNCFFKFHPFFLKDFFARWKGYVFGMLLAGSIPALGVIPATKQIIRRVWRPRPRPVGPGGDEGCLEGCRGCGSPQQKLGVSPWFLLCCERCLEWWVCFFSLELWKTNWYGVFTGNSVIVQGFCPREALTNISVCSNSEPSNLQDRRFCFFYKATTSASTNNNFRFQRLLSLLILPVAM